jgi:hypothetical protein
MHPMFRLFRDGFSNVGVHSVQFSFETLSDSIMPDDFKSAREAIAEMWIETGIGYDLPLGIRGRRPKNPTGVV